MNIHKAISLTLIFMALAPCLAAAKVYKCEGPDGLEFSDKECGDNAAIVELEEDSGGLGGAVSNQTKVELQEKRLGREEDRYIGRLRKQRDNELAAIDSQIRELNRQKTRANNNLAGATYAAGIDQQIAALRASRGQVASSYREQITRAESN